MRKTRSSPSIHSLRTTSRFAPPKPSHTSLCRHSNPVNVSLFSHDVALQSIWANRRQKTESVLVGRPESPTPIQTVSVSHTSASLHPAHSLAGFSFLGGVDGNTRARGSRWSALSVPFSHRRRRERRAVSPFFSSFILFSLITNRFSSSRYVMFFHLVFFLL